MLINRIPLQPFLFSVLCLSWAVAADAIVYNVDFDIQDAGSTANVSGTIETDGTIGTISSAAVFIDWNLVVTHGASGDALTLTGPLSGNNSNLFLTPAGTSFTATAAQILVDPSQNGSAFRICGSAFPTCNLGQAEFNIFGSTFGSTNGFSSIKVPPNADVVNQFGPTNALVIASNESASVPGLGMVGGAMLLAAMTAVGAGRGR